jgi:hypothetical protein
MAAAAQPGVPAAAGKRRFESMNPILIDDEPWLLALPAVLLPTEPALYPQKMTSRQGGSEQLPAALQAALTDTPLTSVLHPCHAHPLTSFLITNAGYATSCDFCGMRCSSTEVPDMVMKLTVDTTHAADVGTVFQIIWICTQPSCMIDNMPVFTSCSRCMWCVMTAAAAC